MARRALVVSGAAAAVVMLLIGSLVIFSAELNYAAKVSTKGISTVSTKASPVSIGEDKDKETMKTTARDGSSAGSAAATADDGVAAAAADDVATPKEEELVQGTTVGESTTVNDESNGEGGAGTSA